MLRLSPNCKSSLFNFLDRTFFHTKTELVKRIPHTKYELYEKLFMMKPDSPEGSKVLRISVLGCPNSGKSSLVNMLARWNVCAVSGKVNTTRTKQTVVYTEGATQLCFLDLPGIIGKQRGFNFKLEKSLIRDPHVGIFESDLIIVVLDVTHKHSQSEIPHEIMKALHYFKDKPAILVLNKIDRVTKRQRLFDVTRRVTDGVVGGKVCHIDKYANRYRDQVVGYRQLLSDSRTETLLQKHQQLRLESGVDVCKAILPDDSAITLDEVLAVDSIADSSSAALSTDLGLQELEQDKTYGEGEVNRGDMTEGERQAVYQATELQVAETEASIKLEKMFGEGSEDRSVEQKEIDEEIMVVLKRQLMVQDVSKQDIMERRQQWREITNHLNRTRETSWRHFDEVFAVSSATGEGIERLRNFLVSQARPGLWHFHSSLITDREPEQLVRMCVWSVCLDVLDKEIPYRVVVVVDNCEKSFDNSLHIHATLHCANNRELMAVIGNRGCNISKIADDSRLMLQNSFQTDIHLKLVAVRKGIPSRQKKRMKSVTDIHKLYPRVPS